MSQNAYSQPGQVIAAVIERGGRFLLCQRPSHKRHGGLWEFPGGKLEPGETFHDAAHRELEEELGLSVVSVGAVRLSITDDASGFVINFVDVHASGEPQLLEHSALQWSSPAEMSKLPLAPTDRAFALYLQS